MIRNLIYDMGNVLLTWNPQALALAGSGDPADAPLFEAGLFCAPDWILNDTGEYDDERMYESAQPRFPQRLHGRLKWLCAHWHELLEPVPGAAEFVRRAKGAGLNGYLLSNASRRFPGCLSAYEAYQMLDGAVVSAHEGVIKPNQEIYQALLLRYDLSAEECFFLDDVPANIEGARRAGIDGMVFTGDFEAVVAALKARGVAI